MKHIDWDNIQAVSGFERLPAGGYIAVITAVQDNFEKEQLYLELDIAEGEYRGYYRAFKERRGFWALKYWKSYKKGERDTRPYFKKLLEDIADSNVGFVINSDDETRLVGKLVGVVLQYGEYIGQDGSTKERIRVIDTYPVADIIEGNFTVPDVKRLNDNVGSVQPKDVPW